MHNVVTRLRGDDGSKVLGMTEVKFFVADGSDFAGLAEANSCSFIVFSFHFINLLD